jgi:hypothetical protein
MQGGVRMAIFDANGRVVTTLFAAAGQAVSTNTYLAMGTYTIRVEALTPAGISLSPMSYNLKGVTLTDPISTLPADPTLSGTSVDYTLTKATSSKYLSNTYDLLDDIVW